MTNLSSLYILVSHILSPRQISHAAVLLGVDSLQITQEALTFAMPQTKIYGLKTHLNGLKAELSTIVHHCIVEALSYPPEKKFQRFFPLEAEDFYYAADRTDAYTIIEISLIEGRSIEAKKQLIRLLYERLALIGISGNDLEITLFENPAHNWGFRGLPGDEHSLN